MSLRCGFFFCGKRIYEVYSINIYWTSIFKVLTVVEPFDWRQVKYLYIRHMYGLDAFTMMTHTGSLFFIHFLKKKLDAHLCDTGEKLLKWIILLGNKPRKDSNGKKILKIHSNSWKTNSKPIRIFLTFLNISTLSLFIHSEKDLLESWKYFGEGRKHRKIECAIEYALLRMGSGKPIKKNHDRYDEHEKQRF